MHRSRTQVKIPKTVTFFITNNFCSHEVFQLHCGVRILYANSASCGQWRSSCEQCSTRLIYPKDFNDSIKDFHFSQEFNDYAKVDIKKLVDCRLVHHQSLLDAVLNRHISNADCPNWRRWRPFRYQTGQAVSDSIEDPILRWYSLPRSDAESRALTISGTNAWWLGQLKSNTDVFNVLADLALVSLLSILILPNRSENMQSQLKVARVWGFSETNNAATASSVYFQVLNSSGQYFNFDSNTGRAEHPKL